MGKTKCVRSNKLHVKHKTLHQNQIDYTRDFDSTFRPLPQIADSNKNFVDQQYGLDSYWEDHIYYQDISEYRQNYNEPAEVIKDDDISFDLHMSDTLKHVLLTCGQLTPDCPVHHYCLLVKLLFI